MSFCRYFSDIFGDRRTASSFWDIINGIVTSRSLKCSRIGGTFSMKNPVEQGGKKVRRLVNQESTKRSDINEYSIMPRVRQNTLDMIAQNPEPEIWVAWDESEIRKPHADCMENAMKVRSLDGKLVSGYRMLFALAMLPNFRGVLQQHVFSSNEEGFTSQSGILEEKLSEAVAGLLSLGKTVFHIFDRGHDDEKLWHNIICKPSQHLLVRLMHLKRKIYLENKGDYEPSTIAKASESATLIGKYSVKAKVKKKNQKKAKVQICKVNVKGIQIIVPTRQTYKLEKRNPDKFKKFTLLVVNIEGMNPCYLLTDVAVTTKESGEKFMKMYMQRWAIEDNFKFLKQIIGYEDVQLLKLESVRTLLAMACVAAQYLYTTIPILHWPEVQFLAKLGYWSGRKNTKPGKRAITEGISRLVTQTITEQLLAEYLANTKEISPAFEKLLKGRIM